MFEKTFCTSPWFSMRIKANGDFAYCRWAEDNDKHNIKDVDIKKYFQNILSTYRKKLLEGHNLPGCHTCYNMEKHKKTSGRQKQLLKTGILFDNWKTIHTNSLLEHLMHSQNNNGETNMMPVDWQIDLGNYCNSSCIMCLPEWSSRLSQEFYRIGLTNNKPSRWVWSEDEECLDKFLETLGMTKNLKYLHFLGGETTIMPAFTKILRHLIDNNRSYDVIVGFTTNLTTWSDELVSILSKFKEVHVGTSIESLSPLNDYIRWPSNITQVKENLEKWIELSRNEKFVLSVRTTPTLLTISRIDELFQFALTKNVNIESCHFLYRPECLQMQGLPIKFRKSIINKLKKVIGNNENNNRPILNVRNKQFVRQAVIEDANSLCNFLENEPYITHHHKNLVSYIKKLEKHRGNCILDYLPEYEEFFTSIGYYR
jgi:MoaA/NifB/PqqE/SkfB family radical SAM enzyme